jgi:transcriptional regulator with XRE-family HTH domain
VSKSQPRPDSPFHAATPEAKYRIARRLVELREAKDISQAELARRLGVATSTVSKWERGIEHLYAAQLPYLAEVLGVHPIAFFTSEAVFTPRQIAAEHLAHSWSLLPPEERGFLELLLDVRHRMEPWNRSQKPASPSEPAGAEVSSSAKTDATSPS